MTVAQLNPSQRTAVTHLNGPLLVLAGAGSGKTRVITQRIAHILERGCRPEAILAVSFTNKAAQEMAERMVPLVGHQAAGKLALSTFHSFGVRFLQEEKRRLGFGDKFVIFDQGDSLGLLREILRGLRKSGAARKLDAAALLSRISNWKNSMLAPDAIKVGDYEYDAVAAEIYPEYQARLRAMRAVDFDDLVAVPVEHLRREDVREAWRQRFRYLMIDEFQDTSRIQLELVKLLTNEFGNVCVVGDDDQSIYSWRGADVTNIIDFERHFPGAKVVKLEDNYRSRAPILAVANAAIARSPHRRYPKELRAARGGGDLVRLCVAEDPEKEAKLIVREIQDLLQEKRKASDIAILYRSNLQARIVEQELRMSGVPYRLFGGTQFFDRKEVKDCAAYLRVIVNPLDEISLRRVLNYPARGIGTTSVTRAERYALAHGMPFVRALEQVEMIGNLPDGARQSIHRFVQIMKASRQRFETGQGIAATARALFEQVGIRDDLNDAADGGKAGGIRWANVEHFLKMIDRFEARTAGDNRTLLNFLTRITLQSEGQAEDAGPQVTLSTLHAAKGLEFPVVFLVGCVEGQLPHSRTTDPKVTEVVAADVEEERRLFYVGVTRAMDRLYITRPQRRNVRGKVTPLVASRFLEGLPEAATETYVRREAERLDTTEIAALGRAFLERMAAAKASST